MHDFLIVGGGTAGCVLAERLTACGRYSVLLIEAGGAPGIFSRIPAGMTKLFNSPADWAYRAQPQENLRERRVFVPRGRMLGGSGAMNAQIHQWCHPADFDGWAEGGARGWSWREVAPTFQQMERLNPAEGNSRRGDSGAMRIARLARPHPLSEAFLAAGAAAGLASLDDYNGGDFAGVARAQLTHDRGARFSTYDAYLKPAMKRRNLQVVSRASARRLLFRDGAVQGLEATAPGGQVTRYLARNIVLAAGAIGTPLLLMRSGVGPSNALSALGITPVIDHPEVGENLQDHPMAVLQFRTRRRDTLLKASSPAELLKWLAFRRGLLATNAVEALAFVKTASGARPDVELLFAHVEWGDQALTTPTQHAYSIGVGVLAPLSRGRVRLSSPAMEAEPLIDLGLLTDPDGADAATLLRGARVARRIAASRPLADETLAEILPGADIVADDELLDALKRGIQTIYHACGTCRMGDAESAPVTSDLRLRGVEGVWVADASVMPSIPSGHPNAVVAMVADRAADMLLRSIRAKT